jgi:YegS/Rv2252/BmrU family lipid kinase
MSKIFVIFNPAARGEKSQRLRAFLDAKAGPTVTLAPTRRAGDAKTLAAEAVAQGYEVVVAAGGDGTINEVVNGLGTSGVALGVLPLGTVNVFAQELGIPRDFDAAWGVIEAGEVRTIDLGCAEAQGQRRLFVQLAGVGFDAQAVRAANWELKKKLGPLSYLWAGAQVLWEPRRVVEVMPGGRGSIVLIGNGRLYGGKLALFPEARLDDGKLDVCVFERWSGLAVTRYVLGVMQGNHTRLPDVKYFQTEQFECRCDSTPVPYELDGEDAGEAPVRFSVLPRALRVIAPAVS